jgi:hypothetical protein
MVIERKRATREDFINNVADWRTATNWKCAQILIFESEGKVRFVRDDGIFKILDKQTGETYYEENKNG